MGFVQFKLFGSKFSPRVSIRRNGQIGFSQGFCNRFNIEDNEDYNVQVFHDKESNCIGFNFVKGKCSDSIPLNRKTKDKHISAKSFLEYIGFDYKKKQLSYTPEREKNGELIIINLSSPIEEKTVLKEEDLF